MVAPVAAAAAAPGAMAAAAPFAVGALAALGLFQGLMGGSKARAEAEAASRISAAQAEAGNAVRKEKNAAAAAENALNLWSQSINNARTQRSVGRALAQEGRAITAQTAAGSAGSWSGSIRDAEERGVVDAMAATSGLVGGVVDQVDRATDLRQQVGREFATRQLGVYASRATERVGTIASSLLSSLDNRSILANMDYNQDVLQVQHALPMAAYAVSGVMNSGAIQAMSALSASKPLTATPGTGVQMRESSLSSVGGGDLADFAFANKPAAALPLGTSSAQPAQPGPGYLYDLWSR